MSFGVLRWSGVSLVCAVINDSVPRFKKGPRSVSCRHQPLESGGIQKWFSDYIVRFSSWALKKGCEAFEVVIFNKCLQVVFWSCRHFFRDFSTRWYGIRFQLLMKSLQDFQYIRFTWFLQIFHINPDTRFHIERSYRYLSQSLKEINFWIAVYTWNFYACFRNVF